MNSLAAKNVTYKFLSPSRPSYATFLLFQFGLLQKKRNKKKLNGKNCASWHHKTTIFPQSIFCDLRMNDPIKVKNKNNRYRYIAVDTPEMYNQKKMHLCFQSCLSPNYLFFYFMIYFWLQSKASAIEIFIVSAHQ